MSTRYIITFSKKGYIKYTSHLDMVRLFERVFKRGDIRLDYSQGFNPHPKMVFAQPLSLGYTSESEQLEIETKENYAMNVLFDTLGGLLPEGIEIKEIKKMPPYRPNEGKASIASKVRAAVFTVEIPVSGEKLQSLELSKLCSDFMAQGSITAMKKQKKKKELKEIDIRPMILDMKLSQRTGKDEETGEILHNIIVEAKLAQGSSANLSPELLIPAFLEFAGLSCKRSEIEVERKCLIYEE